MIETISANETFSVNKGEEVISSRPPSSLETNNTTASQSAIEVDLRSELLEDVNASSERVAGAKQSGESLEDELTRTIDALNEKLSRLDREILFKVDKRIDRNYISVIDKESKEVLREFPPQDIRNFIARFEEFNAQLDSSADVKSLIVNLEV